MSEQDPQSGGASPGPDADPEEFVHPLDLWLSSMLDGHPEGQDGPEGPDGTDGLAGVARFDLASPLVAARHHSLSQAAAMLGSVPALDQVTRSRLVNAALESLGDRQIASRPQTGDLVPQQRLRQGSRQWLVPVGAVAAATALLAGIGLALGSLDKSDDLKQSGSAATILAAEGAALAEFGDLTDPATLRAVFDASPESSGRDIADASPMSEQRTAAQIGTDAVPRALGELSSATGCLMKLNPGGKVPDLAGTGSFEGAPVGVASAVEGDATLVYLFSPSDCRIVAFQQLAAD